MTMDSEEFDRLLSERLEPLGLTLTAAETDPSSTPRSGAIFLPHRGSPQEAPVQEQDPPESEELWFGIPKSEALEIMNEVVATVHAERQAAESIQESAADLGVEDSEEVDTSSKCPFCVNNEGYQRCICHLLGPQVREWRGE